MQFISIQIFWSYLTKHHFFKIYLIITLIKNYFYFKLILNILLKILKVIEIVLLIFIFY